MTGATESEAFRSAKREREAGAFAMWVFLASEAMLFGAIILVYLWARLSYAEAFAEASRHLSVLLGTVNTAVLLTSSLTIALAHAWSEAERWRAAGIALATTALLGMAFLGIKAYEYWREYHEGLAPVLGAPFLYEGPDPARAEYFFNLYFTMTSLHAIHLLGGVVVVVGILALWHRTKPAGRVRRVHAAGLYWHFVDIVWVFLFPILYLIDR